MEHSPPSAPTYLLEVCCSINDAHEIVKAVGADANVISSGEKVKTKGNAEVIRTAAIKVLESLPTYTAAGFRFTVRQV